MLRVGTHGACGKWVLSGLKDRFLVYTHGPLSGLLVPCFMQIYTFSPTNTRRSAAQVDEPVIERQSARMPFIPASCKCKPNEVVVQVCM